MNREDIENEWIALQHPPALERYRHKLYKRRWFLLSIICLANLSNAINWICFSPIANLTAQFYSIDYGAVNLLSTIFMLSAISLGFFSCILIDLVGIKWSIVVGAWLNFVGALLRVFSSSDKFNIPAITSPNYAMLLVGQTMCALGQPFIMFVSTKFATCWFAHDQRALANTMALTSNLIGTLVGAVLSPMLVTTASNEPEHTGMSEMSRLLIVCAIVSLIPAILSCFIRRSMPKHAPSESSRLKALEVPIDVSQSQQSLAHFRAEVARHLRNSFLLFKNVSFIILSLCFGIGLGVFNAITTLVEQLFCVRGYSNADVGYFTGALILAGLISSYVAGWLMDKTKRYELLAKLCFGALSLALVSLTVAQTANNDESYVYAWLAFSFCLLGLFALPLLPICFESSVECTYPVSESTSTGFLFIWGQLFGVIMIEFYPRIASEVSTTDPVYLDTQTCITGQQQASNETLSDSGIYHRVRDFKNPMFIQLALIFVTTLIFILFFKCPNLRHKAETVLNSDQQNTDVEADNKQKPTLIN